MCSLKKTHKYIPMSQTAKFSSVQACAMRPNGCTCTSALGSPMASVVFTRGHLGTTHAADRLRARESTAACMRGRTRVVMGRARARIRAHARTAKGARRASAICVVFCSSLAPVWRARANTKTRDYRTFESAHRAQTTCAPAHQQARKQAPQSVAQWHLPFSRNVHPRSSRTRRP